jgi:hypothetical protein
MKSSLAVLLLVAWLLGLLVLYASPATAAPIAFAAPHLTATGAPTSALPRLVGPAHDVRDGSTELSSNWSGYVVAGGRYSSVTATWTQPYLEPFSAPGTAASFWVGLDGWGSPTVEQCGTTAEEYSGGGVTYYPWYEMYPGPEMEIYGGVTVSPGDVMQATVTTDGAGNFTMMLRNVTTGVTSGSGPEYNPDAACYSAEAIAEAPTNGSTGSEYPLAPFGTVHFTNCAIDGSPISSFNWDRLNMEQDGTMAARTSPLGSDGASFLVSTDLTPPTTTVSGAGSHWHNQPVTLTFTGSDNPGGSGLAHTEYKVGSGSWTQGTLVTIPAPADHSYDGTHTVCYRSVDNAGNREPTQTCTVKIDTVGPICKAKSVTVKRYHKCTLSFYVSDKLRPRVATVILIKTQSGVTKKNFAWGYGANGWWTYKFTCTLNKGTYRYYVYGEDLAGNRQSVVGSATLRVT